MTEAINFLAGLSFCTIIVLSMAYAIGEAFAAAVARWRSSGLISPCRGYVYRDGKWHPRSES